MAAKVLVYEVFNSIQGKGPYAGTLRVFARFQGCPLSCIYCESSSARPFDSAREVKCNSTRGLRNPVSIKDLVELVKSLWTPLTPHLSLTRGDPLLYTILEFAQDFRAPLYLKTNTMFSRKAKQLKHAVHIVACDIKLPEHRAIFTHDLLLSGELCNVKCFSDFSAYVFAKVTAFKETSSDMVGLVAQSLATIDDDQLLVLQSGITIFSTQQPDNSQLLRLMDTAGAYLNQVRSYRRCIFN